MKARGWMVTAMVAAGVALTVGTSAPARAACTPASISVRPTSGPPGQKVTVTGQGFYSVCSDIVIGPTTPPTPERGIRLQFVQGSETVPLGQVDADSQGKFQKEVIAPLASTSGDATVRAAGTSATAEAAFVVTSIATSTSSRSTTTTTARNTTSSNKPATTTTTEQTFPTLEPESTTTPTVKLKGGGDGRDWTGWIVLGIVGVGLGIFTVSWRILRAHPPSD